MALFSSSDDNLFLGIDIGDSSLKMVELRKKGKKIFLSNYAFSENVTDVNFTKVADVNYLAQAILKVKAEAGIKAKKVTASLPTFSVFSSIIHLPTIDRKNMDKIVADEAKKVIPLPLEEMILDWKIVPHKTGEDEKNGSRVFLTGSPKKLVRRYIEIFRLAKLELASLETETFSLVRSLLGNDPSTVMIVEIGANSTDLSVVQDSIPVLNRSLEVCGSTVTQTLADKLGLSFIQAEQFKLDLSASLSDGSKDELPQLIIKTLGPVIHEIEYMREFFEKNGASNKIEKIVLSGGGALLLNLADYLSKHLNLQVIIGDPFSRVSYPVEMQPIINEVGSKLAVAAGLALREIS
ncbi:MAG: type IV pilus assembly protein PilM [Patescibacteria group bacterium]|jgi:type IV pilus assembly protein PilM|nr:type IV pilus assembly protein PilM [Patescibacteria group bacterium]